MYCNKAGGANPLPDSTSSGGDTTEGTGFTGGVNGNILVFKTKSVTDMVATTDGFAAGYNLSAKDIVVHS